MRGSGKTTSCQRPIPGSRRPVLKLILSILGLRLISLSQKPETKWTPCRQQCEGFSCGERVRLYDVIVQADLYYIIMKRLIVDFTTACL